MADRIIEHEHQDITHYAENLVRRYSRVTELAQAVCDDHELRVSARSQMQADKREQE